MPRCTASRLWPGWAPLAEMRPAGGPGFAGRLTAAGRLATSRGAAERRSGCEVLLHGSISGTRALGRELGLPSSVRADSHQLVVSAYRKWGDRFPGHVLGEYAAFIRDPESGSAVLTHDALGMAPVFYAAADETLAFSTEILDLLDQSRARDIDQEFLADFLTTGQISSARTPYRGIKRLLPGTAIVRAGGRITSRPTWRLSDVPPLSCPESDYHERFRELLAEAVRESVHPTGPTWVSLSGGLDSSSIACMAAARGISLGALSFVNPSQPEIDERRWMRAVLDRYPSPWHPIDAETLLPFSGSPEQILDEPSSSAIFVERRRAINTLLASHGVERLLTGLGGDAVLCASPGRVPAHLSDALFSARPADAFRDVAEWKAGSPDQRSWSYWLLRGLLAPAATHLFRRSILTTPRHPLPPWLDRDFASRMRIGARAGRPLAPRCPRPSEQDLADALWINALATSSVPARQRSYEIRSPLPYRPLVEFMYAVPWHQKLRPKCDRFLQRRALKGILPELVRRRAGKAGGSWEMVEGLRRSPRWVECPCDSPKIASLGIADRERWRQAVAQAAVGQTHGDVFFLAGVAVELWLKGLELGAARKAGARRAAAEAEFGGEAA